MAQEPPGKGSIGMSFSFDTGGEKRPPHGAPDTMPGAEVDYGRSAGRVRDLPLRLVVLADFGGRRREGNRVPLTVDKEGFRGAFADLDVRLDLRLKHHLGPRPEPIDISLEFRDLKDFRRSVLAEKVPGLAAGRALVAALAAIQAGAGRKGDLDAALGAARTVPALATAVERAAAALSGPAPAHGTPAAPAASPAPAAASTDDDGLDALLGMVDTGPATPSAEAPAHQDAAKRAVDSLVGSLVGGGQRGNGGGGALAAGPGFAAALEAAAPVVAAQEAELFDHPDLVRVEGAWRSLKVMVDRLDFRAGVSLDIVDCGRDEIAEVFARTVAEPELAGISQVSPGLVVVDFDFANSATDLDSLQRLGEQAEEIQTPVVVNVGADLFGVDDLNALVGRDNPAALLEAPGRFDQWNALRDKEAGRWLVAACNRFRLPPDGDPTTWTPRWGQPAWILGILAGHSQAAIGWPTDITGRGRAVDSLPLATVGAPGVPAMELPLEIPLGAPGASGLADGGVAALVAEPNRDAVFLAHAPTLHRPERFQGRTAPERQLSSLPYQLMAATVAKWLMLNAGDALRAGEDGAIAQAMETLVSALVADTGPGAGVTAEVHRDGGGQRFCALRLRTGRSVLGGAELALDLPI